jgi:hypothetical protein
MTIATAAANRRKSKLFENRLAPPGESPPSGYGMVMAVRITAQLCFGRH